MVLVPIKSDNACVFITLFMTQGYQLKYSNVIFVSCDILYLLVSMIYVLPFSCVILFSLVCKKVIMGLF